MVTPGLSVSVSSVFYTFVILLTVKYVFYLSSETFWKQTLDESVHRSPSSLPPLLPSSHRPHTGTLLISFLSDLVSDSCFCSPPLSPALSHSLSPSPLVSFWVSHQSLVCVSVCVCLSTGMPFSSFLVFLCIFFSCFSTSIGFWYVRMFLWYPDINAGYEPDSHITARSQACACWNRDCCTHFRCSLRARIYQHASWLIRRTSVFWCKQSKRNANTYKIAHLHITPECRAGERKRGGN